MCRRAPLHTRLRLDFAGGYALACRTDCKWGAIGLVEDLDHVIREKGPGTDALGEQLELWRFRRLHLGPG